MLCITFHKQAICVQITLIKQYLSIKRTALTTPFLHHPISSSLSSCYLSIVGLAVYDLSTPSVALLQKSFDLLFLEEKLSVSCCMKLQLTDCYIDQSFSRYILLQSFWGGCYICMVQVVLFFLCMVVIAIFFHSVGMITCIVFPDTMIQC